MKKRGIIYNRNVEPDRKVKHTHSQMKLLDKIQGVLKLEPKQYLADHLQSIFFGNADSKKKQQIYHLLEVWNPSSNLKDAIANSSETFNQDLIIYIQNQVLSARVYMKVQQYFSSKGSAQLYNLLRQAQLTLSYDRFWWKRDAFSQSWNSNELQEMSGKQGIVTKILEEVKTFNNQFLNTLFSFLEKIGLLSTNKQSKNVFMRKIERITSIIQRQIYLESISLPLLDIINFQKAKGKEKQLFTKQMQKLLPNYHFYTSYQKKNIDQLHLKYQQYQYLQQAHDYVQWMFPNHFKSMFNGDSYPLNYAQSHLFHSDPMIGLKVLKSIVIFLDFWGIFLDVSTLKLEIIDLQRLKAVLIYRTHNLLRLKRILAFLSVSGFREVALALINFLLEKTSSIQELRKAHSQMIKNEQKYGSNQLNHDKSAKIQCRLQLQEFPPKHMIFSKIQQASHLKKVKQ